MPKKLAVLVLLCSMLVGCEDKKSISYLMQHPDALRNEVENCQVSSATSPSDYCEKVLYAAVNVTSLLNEMQEDPQAFGMRILKEQSACAKTKMDLQTAKQEFETTKTKAAQEKMDELQKKLAQQREEVKALLVVVGILDPSS